MSDETPAEGADTPAEDDADDQAEGSVELSVEEFEGRLADAEDALADAETEADLDDVEADLDDVAQKLEAASLPDADDEEEEDPADALDAELSELRDDLDSQRGPYAEDVADEIESVQSTVESTRWTENGAQSFREAVAAFLDETAEALGAEGDEAFETPDESTADESTADTAQLAAVLDDVTTAVTDAGLHADDDAATIQTLLDATDTLDSAVEDAEEWDDLETHEQLEAEGFYDVLGHYKDFPLEWAALKQWEERGNVEMVLLALDSLQSDFMQRHCMEAITRMNDEGAFDEMHSLAQRRDEDAVRALGKMAAEDAVDTLVDFVDEDSNPQLQTVVFKALGEIGHSDAVQPLANKLVADNDDVRPIAARALGMIGDTRAVDPLADTLADDEVDTVRAAAAWALRQIGTERALEAATAAVDDDAYIVQVEGERAADALDAGEEAAATA